MLQFTDAERLTRRAQGGCIELLRRDNDMSKMLKGATKSLASHSFGEIGAVGLSRVLIRQSLLKCTVLWNSLCS